MTCRVTATAIAFHLGISMISTMSHRDLILLAVLLTSRLLLDRVLRENEETYGQSWPPLYPPTAGCASPKVTPAPAKPPHVCPPGSKSPHPVTTVSLHIEEMP